MLVRAVDDKDSKDLNVVRTIDQQTTQLIEQDIRAELVHMALLFRRYIIGAGPRTTGPSGSLTTVAKGKNAPSMQIARGLRPWARRNKTYLAEKKRAGAGGGWFDNRGWKARQFDARYASRKTRKTTGQPKETGLMFRSMRADTLEVIFGGISVTFHKAKDQKQQVQATLDRGGKKMRLLLGTVYVKALGRLTPSMLPALATGQISSPSHPSSSYLDLIASYDEGLAYRMGVMRNGIYRPTLEPFLGFFLTRSLPHAVNERIKKGSFGTINRN